PYPSALPGVLPASSRTGSSFGRPASAEPGVLPGSTFFTGAFLMTFTSPCSIAGFRSFGLSAIRHLHGGIYAAWAVAVWCVRGERASRCGGGRRGPQRARGGDIAGARRPEGPGIRATRRRRRGRPDGKAVRQGTG